ncbi:MAG: SOS response-associated peptidase [Anaerolineales bacterium]|nr:SOS response-associated peptidase [Anaerolineales bacterium]
MCGRFSLTVSPEKLQAAFPQFRIPRDLPPSYNIAPSQPIPVIPNEGKNTLDFYRWGLIPSWADEKFLKYNLINARGETAAEKPSFRSSFRHHRCLVPADGFYEWQKTGGNPDKTPYFIRMKDQRPFAFAGLWDLWHSPHGDPIRSAAILTTQPNSLIKPIHNRMPVILPPEAYQEWLSPQEPKAETLQDLIKPFPGEEMEAYPVSTYVNNPRNNSPQCIQPLER